MTKISKTTYTPITLDRETFKAESANFIQTKTKKTQIIISGSLRKGSNGLIHLKKKDFGTSKRWPTFTITREGVIYQHFDPLYYSDYLQNKEIDKKSINVCLENMGAVWFDPNRDLFVNWIDEETEEQPFNKLWKNNRYWEAYTDSQYEALAQLGKHLCKEYGIDLNVMKTNTHSDESSRFQGILSRSNHSQYHTDVNPSFDYAKLFRLLELPFEQI